MKDKEFIEAFQRGDEKAFEELINLYMDNALSFAKRFIKDSFLCEDIVQESFAYIYVYRDKYNPTYSFKTYLFTIVRNKCIDQIRKYKDTVAFEDYHGGTNVGPEEIMDRELLQDIVRWGMNQLKDDYRQVIYLAHYEEMSYKETAKVMDKSVTQIKVLLFRARKKLKGILEMEGSLL